MAISERRRLTYTAIAVTIVGIVVGLLLGIAISPSSTSGPGVKTFNIVPYHWGFAFYDEEWNKLDRIEVAQGTQVRLVAFPVQLLAPEIRQGLGQEEVTDPGLANHGVAIAQYGFDLRPNAFATTLEDAVDSVEFTADKAGEFTIACSVYCGLHHVHMVAENSFVVK